MIKEPKKKKPKVRHGITKGITKTHKLSSSEPFAKGAKKAEADNRPKKMGGGMNHASPPRAKANREKLKDLLI